MEELTRIVGRIRQRWPGVEIWLRGDSGFCREELMAWCERTGQAARVFKDFRYRTLDGWSRERRVIGKAEHLPRGANPRFVVTSLGPETMAARALYELPC